MSKFKTILIIFSLISFYFLIGIYFNNSNSKDFTDTICFVDDFFDSGYIIIFSKIYIV